MVNFLSNERRSKATVISRIVLIVVLAITIISTFMEYSLLMQINDGMYITDAQITANDSRQSLVSMLNLIVLIVCGVIYLLWFYRAYQNARLINGGLKYKQWWAIGCWFVPIMCVFMPYVIMRDMYINAALHTGLPYRNIFIKLWWAGYLITNFFDTLYARVVLQYGTIEAFMMGDIIDIVSSVLAILTVLCSIKVIRDYNAMEKLIPTTTEAFEQGRTLNDL